MKSGIYRVYSVHGDQRASLGRVVVSNGHTHVVEDRDGSLTDVIPDGYIDAQKERRWAGLQQSPYFQVVSEADLEPQNLEQPNVQPDESFDVVDDLLGTRRRLQAYGDDFFLDGKHLDAQQVETLFNQARLGEVHLLPVLDGVQQ